MQWFYLAVFDAEYRRHSQSKNGLYFPNFRQYFPNEKKKQKQISCLHFSIKTASLVPYRQLEQVRCLSQPNWRITNPTSFEIMQQFSDKKRFLLWWKPDVLNLFTDYWLIGRVLLDPAVHYLGPRGIVSSNDRHIGIGLPLCFNR